MAAEIDGGIVPVAGENVIERIGVANVQATMQRFEWADYLVFVLMLLICIVVGLYFGCIRSSKTAADYLIGGRSMSTFPVAMSLTASFVSGIFLLGVPTEIYVYGFQYMYILGGVILMAFMYQTIYLPIFLGLNITSINEYLERRFDKRIRIFSSVLLLTGGMIWMPVVIYVPALAFNQVTGVNVHFITPTICILCIFYTAIGGIKAVVWTDVIQTGFMVGAIILVGIKGTLDVGGFGVVWERNWQGDRIEAPDFDINPLSRHTVWGLVVGGSVYMLKIAAVNQHITQRYLSLPTFRSAKRALWLFILGLFTFFSLCCYSGMLIYATYHKCDPLTTRLVRKKDQLFPLLVMDVLGDYPGLPGLFIAGIFSAALSSLSTGLNSLAAIVLEDFSKSLLGQNLTDKQSKILMKITIVILGAICVGLVFVIEQLGIVLQLNMSIGAITAGPGLALFTMGMLLPWITANGALVGGISGLVFMSWLCFNAQAAIAAGEIHFPEKPVNTEDCYYNFTPKASPSTQFRNDSSLNATHSDEPFMLYRLSHLWYTLVGASVSILIGLIVSCCTKPLNSKDVDPALLVPFVRRFVHTHQVPNQPNSDEIITNGCESSKENGNDLKSDFPLKESHITTTKSD